ncbi:class I SAM-dependent methyltransferase [Aeromonas veronii]|uniref:class I SAM-dependent methyltransferase n=1 Tax=Aeromonas veronii TaxID=654 RepID=UPI0035BB1B90
MKNNMIYDIWSDMYSNTPINPLMESEQAIISKKIFKLTKNKNIIDAACGCGRISKMCLDNGADRVYAFDVSSKMVAKCQQLNKNPRLTVMHGNLLEIPLPDEIYDVYISSLAVGHVDSLFSMLKEATRVIKSDGDILISDYHPIRARCGFKRGVHTKDGYLELEHFTHGISDWIYCLNQLNLAIVDIDEGYLDNAYLDYDKWSEHPDIINETQFEISFKIPAIWVIHAKKI